MAASGLVIGVIFLLQSMFGILGNSFLFYHYLFLCFTGCRVRSMDVILTHLTVANFLTLLCKGVPQTMAAFGGLVSLSDVGCKLLSYLYTVGRGVSIGSTCILSVFQAITISPRDSRWAEFKMKAPKYVGSSLCLIWVLYSLVNIVFLIYMTGKESKKNLTSLKNYGYCSSVRIDKTTGSLHAALLSIPDALCLGLMLWARGSMVCILYRHKQRMRHIRRTHVTPRSSPESRATKSIFLLVSAYVCFYTLSCIFQVCVSLIYKPNWLLVNTSVIFAGFFPFVSPFLLMSRDSSVLRLCFACVRHRKTPSPIRSL